MWRVGKAFNSMLTLNSSTIYVCPLKREKKTNKLKLSINNRYTFFFTVNQIVNALIHLSFLSSNFAMRLKSPCEHKQSSTDIIIIPEKNLSFFFNETLYALWFWHCFVFFFQLVMAAQLNSAFCLQFSIHCTAFYGDCFIKMTTACMENERWLCRKM